MEFNNLVACLRENGVDVHPNFVKAYTTSGCIEAYREIFDGVVEDIADYATAAVNGTCGFNGKIRKGIKELTDLVVYISNENTPSKLTKIAEKRTKIKRKATGLMSKLSQSKNSMKDELIERINFYKAGVKYQLGRDMANDRKGILEECLEGLEEIEDALNNVIDVTSPAALDYAEQILEGLRSWEIVVAQLRHDATTPAALTKLASKAKTWAEGLVVANKTSMFSSARKEIDITTVSFDENKISEAEPLAQIGIVSPILEKVDIFRNNISDYKKHMSASENTTEVEAELAKVEAELVKLDERRAEILQKYDNGELSDEDVNDLAEELQEDIQEAEFRRDEIKAEIHDRKTNLRLSESNLKTLDGILAVVNKYRETDPGMIAYIGDLIDFDALSHIMTGTFDVTDESALNLLEDAERIIEADKKNNLSHLREQHRTRALEHRKTRLGQKDPQQQTEEEKENRKKSNIDFLRKSNQKRPQQQTPNNTQPTDGNKNEQPGNLNEVFRP